MVVSKALHAEAFAAYTFFASTLTAIGLAASVGIGIAAVRSSAAFTTSRDGHHHVEVLSSLLAAVLAGGVAAGVTAIAAPWMLGTELRVPATLLALGAFFFTLQGVAVNAVSGFGDFRAILVSGVMAGAVSLLGALWTLHTGHLQPSLIGLALGTAMQAIFCIRYVLSHLLSLSWPPFEMVTGKLPKVVATSSKAFATAVVSTVALWGVGRILLRSGTGEYAVYAASLQWYSLALVIPAAISTAMLPTAVRLHLSGMPKPLRSLTRKAIAVGCGCSFLVAATVIALTDWIARFYGFNFQSHRLTLGILMCGAVATAPANTLGNVLVAMGEQGTWLLLTVIWAAVLLAGCAIFVDTGALGSVSCIACAYLALSGMALCVVRRLGLA